MLDNGTYYFIEGYFYDGLLITSKVSCDDAFFIWSKTPAHHIPLYKI